MVRGPVIVRVVVVVVCRPVIGNMLHFHGLNHSGTASAEDAG